MKQVILVVIVLVAGMSSAQAQHGRHADAPRDMKAHMHSLANKLGFSDDQKAEARELLQGSFTDLKVIREEMRANRDAMKTLIEDSGYDADAVAELSRLQGELFAQQLEIRLATRAAFNDILSDDQRARLAEFKAKRSDRRAFLRQQRMERHRYFRDQGGT